MSRVEPPDLPPDVIARALDGDDAAFRAFYERYDGTLRWAVGLRVYRWPQLVPEFEDLVQEIWWRITKNRGKPLRRHDPTRGLPFWRFLALIVMRLAWKIGKRRLRHIEAKLGDPFDEGVEERTEARLMAAELLDRIAEVAKARLDEKDWALFEDYYVRGDRLKDVGARLGMNENAVYKRNERLQRKLQAIAEELLGQALPTGSSELVAIALATLVAMGHRGPSNAAETGSLGATSTEVEHE